MDVGCGLMAHQVQSHSICYCKGQFYYRSIENWNFNGSVNGGTIAIKNVQLLVEWNEDHSLKKDCISSELVQMSNPLLVINFFRYAKNMKWSWYLIWCFPSMFYKSTIAIAAKPVSRLGPGYQRKNVYSYFIQRKVFLNINNFCTSAGLAS